MRSFHWVLLFSLSFGQFLPLSFCVMALPTILLSQGVPLEKISLIYVLGFVWVFKFLWAPYVDKIRFGSWGHYKPWLLICQFLLAGSTVAFSLLGDIDNFNLILMLGVVIATFASTQDIAADAVACRLIPEEKRGMGSAIQLAGGLSSTIFGGGLVLVLYEHVSWQSCMWFIALLVAATFVLILFFDETEIDLSTSEEVNVPTFSRLFSFWRKPGMLIWGLILIVLPLSITAAWSMASPILIGLGWSPGDIGILNSIIAPLLGIGVTGVFGYLLNKFDKWVVLCAMPILQILALVMLYNFMNLKLETSGMIIAILLVYLLDIALFVILNAFKLEYSELGTEGTDYTVQNSLHGLAAFSVAAGATYFANSVGFANLILAAACFTVVSGIFLYSIILFQKRAMAQATGELN